MKTSVLENLNREINKLNDSEKLWLLEQIAQKPRNGRRKNQIRQEMVAMANDPEIQREIAAIENEFAPCLMDDSLFGPETLS